MAKAEQQQHDGHTSHVSRAAALGPPRSVLTSLAWAGLAVLLLSYGYLAFRWDSSFFTVPWMPREVARRILSVTNYRNFWGFGFLGFYAGALLGAWWWLKKAGRWQWGTMAVWCLPLFKEVLQMPIPGRHGTWPGALYGLGGAMLGLALGCGMRAAFLASSRMLRRQRKPSGKRNPLRDPRQQGG